MTNSDFLWWRDGVIYQIYPRSFADSNNDGIGDIPGITAHLDYLANLGVDALWLSPIYPSPNVDFGYDVSDYTGIDPAYGTMQDFDTLLAAAHQRHIHIVMDLVLNHTSDQHPWFLDARSSRTSPHHDWYLWRSPRPGQKVPNNWESVVDGKAWEYVPEIDQYYYHAYFHQQPDVNWRNPQTKAALLDVFRFWLAKGVDGFRLDVFNIYFKDADFSNNPPALGIRAYDRQKHLYDRDQPEMLPVLAEIRQILDSYPERFAVGEPMASSTEQSAHYVGKDRLHQTFNFEFQSAGWNPYKLLQVIQKWDSILRPDSWPNYVLNNHDLPRLASHLQHGEDDGRARVAAGLLLTLRGTPFMYYGEEIGMRDISLPRAQILDPVGRRYWPVYKGRDGCRAPMQWNAAPYAGFSQKASWLPLHPDYTRRNVEAQQSDPHSLLTHYCTLLSLRHEYSALQRGEFIPLTLQPTLTLAYLRQDEQQKILVALNFSSRNQEITLDESTSQIPWKLLYSSAALPTFTLNQQRLTLAPYEVLLLLAPDGTA